jgi:excisionase family DNA binding protein
MDAEEKSKNPNWYTIKEAAEYLGVTEPTIYRWMREGLITYRKIGDSTRFLQEDLDSHVQIFRSAKDVENVQEFCPVCHHTELIRGRVQSTGLNYFYPEKTKFWTFKTSHIETQARMCTRCGAVTWFGDKTKLAGIKKDGSVTSIENLPPTETDK